MTKYPALDSLTTLIQIVGYLSLILFVMGGLFSGSLTSFAGCLVIGLIICIPLIAFGELIQVFIDIEENTRS